MHTVMHRKAAVACGCCLPAEVVAWLHQRPSEELREVLFQTIKQQQQGRACGSITRGQSLGQYQALLLRWMVVAGSNCRLGGSSGSRRPGSSGSSEVNSKKVASSMADVLQVELLLLSARMAVKLQCWKVAQAAAVAAERVGKNLVSGPSSRACPPVGYVCVCGFVTVGGTVSVCGCVYW